jgi:hypothetical protein
MLNFNGKIFDIHIISEKEAQIVIRKKNGDKIVPVAISIFGFFWEKAQKQGIRQGDKIKGKLYLKSKFWDKGNKYYTDTYFKEIQILERANTIQFVSEQKRLMVDKETGEII